MHHGTFKSTRLSAFDPLRMDSVRQFFERMAIFVDLRCQVKRYFLSGRLGCKIYSRLLFAFVRPVTVSLWFGIRRRMSDIL